MLKMKLNTGNLVINDNNDVIVDEQTAKEIQKQFEENEDNKDKEKPNLTIKD